MKRRRIGTIPSQDRRNAHGSCANLMGVNMKITGGVGTRSDGRETNCPAGEGKVRCCISVSLRVLQ